MSALNEHFGKSTHRAPEGLVEKPAPSCGMVGGGVRWQECMKDPSHSPVHLFAYSANSY